MDDVPSYTQVTRAIGFCDEGLPHDVAERLIVEGFFQSVLEKLRQPDLHAAVWAAVEQKLPGSAG